MARRSRTAATLSLDSFLDIVTNVVGVLILVALVTVLSAADVKVSLGTPVIHEPPKDSQRVLYECRHNQLFRMDEPSLDALVNRTVLAYGAGSAVDIDEVPALFERQDVGDATYRVRARVADGRLEKHVVWIYEPRPSSQGETAAMLRDEGSSFRRHLESLDRRRHFLYFVVREDSFEVFMAARKWARQRGFDTGWHPRKKRAELAFSKGGGLGNQVQ